MSGNVAFRTLKNVNITYKMSKLLANLRTLSDLKSCLGNCRGYFRRNVTQLARSRVLADDGEDRRIKPLGWLLLLVPTSTFALGAWQVQRKKWKENLIAQLADVTHRQPIDLPKSVVEINQSEYHRVRVRGTFLHDQELYMGPRTLIVKGVGSTDESSGIFAPQNKKQGYLVITPFKLADRNETILVNRGWIPTTKLSPKSRVQGHTEGEVDLVGVIRLHENRPQFSIKNQPNSKLFLYRDLEAMSALTGASPIFLDAATETDVEGGPIGGQTRVTLRNEHLSYIFTWFSLSAATSYMWYKLVMKRAIH